MVNDKLVHKKILPIYRGVGIGILMIVSNFSLTRVWGSCISYGNQDDFGARHVR